MADEGSNDNHAVRPDQDREPDAFGQAAILLVESLIHGLVARRVITADDAIEIVGIAAEVKEDIAEDLGDSPGTLRRSLAILSSIGASLRIEAGR